VRTAFGRLLGRPSDDLVALEEELLLADVGVKATARILEALTDRRSAREPVRATLARVLEEILDAGPDQALRLDAEPSVLMFVGVNGTGKTTTLAKLAARLRSEGRMVVVAAADTYRAAAIDQLRLLTERAGARLVAHQPGSDPAAVAFDAVQSAMARRANAVLVDTAGRLHTSSGLMAELAKVRRVIARAVPGAPHEVLLVVDATTGQNALEQARVFGQAVAVSGIVLAKLDGTARGGIVIAIREELGLPIKLVGVGEGLDDLVPFDPRAFVRALLGGSE